MEGLGAMRLKILNRFCRDRAKKALSGCGLHIGVHRREEYFSWLIACGHPARHSSAELGVFRDKQGWALIGGGGAGKIGKGIVIGSFP